MGKKNIYVSRYQNYKLNKSGKHNATTKESLTDSPEQPKAQHNLQNPKRPKKQKAWR